MAFFFNRMPRKKTRLWAVLWLLLFVLAGFLVFNPVLFGLDLYPLALVAVVLLLLTYESYFRKELEKMV